MNIALTIIFACLLLCVILLVLRILMQKRQIRKFAYEVKRLKDSDYNHMIKIDCFDKDFILLANGLNDHIEIQKNLASQYQNDICQLKDIIAGISHDFRTPLTAAKGYLQMIEKNGKLSETDAYYLSVAIHKTNYLKKISDDFFEISVLEANENIIEKTQINLNNIISESILEQIQWIEQNKIETDFSIPDETIFINTNEHYFRRILDNIFSNARKYADTFIGIDVKCNNNDVIIRVTNNTTNSEIIDVSKVFEPFYRGQSRNKDGSGLGLYVVKCLADKLGVKVNAFFDGNLKFTVEINTSRIIP